MDLFDVAVLENDIPVVAYLLENGVTASDLTVHLAFASNNTEIFFRLIQNEANCIPTLDHLREFALSHDDSIMIVMSRPKKISTCRMLVQFAETSFYISTFLQSLLRDLIVQRRRRDNTGNEWVSILLEAGVATHSSSCDDLILLAIQAKNAFVCELLVQQYGANPFIGGRSGNCRLAPLNAADGDMNILNLFSRLWNSNFDTNHGDLPMHILCRNKKVSNQAIMLWVEQHPDALAVVNDDGNCPLHVAAISGVGSSVIETLLRAYPDALEVVNNEGLCPLYVAAASYLYADIDVIYTLLRACPQALGRLQLPTSPTAVEPEAVIDTQAQIESLRAEIERLRAEKDTEIERLRAEKDAEIDRLRAQIAEIEDAQKADARNNTNVDDGSSGISDSSGGGGVAAVVDPPSAAAAAVDGLVGQGQEQEALWNNGDSGETTAPPSKKAKTVH